jgi:hypothetical protein
MSHAPQRKEKNCLNCGTIVQGKVLPALRAGKCGA